MKALLISISALLIFFASSCSTAESDAEKLKLAISELTSLQEEFSADSLLTEEEILSLKEKTKSIEVLGNLLDEKYTGDKRADFTPHLCDGSYDLLTRIEKLNNRIYFIGNSATYMRDCEPLIKLFPDISCWNELMQNVSFTNPKGKAYIAMAEQHMMVKCQIDASEDLVLTDEEIEQIVEHFKTSMNTYQEMFDYFQDKDEEFKAFDGQISGISLEFKYRNEKYAARLESCENYDKLSERMMQVLMEE